MSDAAILGELAAKARELGAASAADVARREAESEDAGAREALARVAAAGLTAWTVPADFGGADSRGLVASDQVSTRAVCAIRSALAYHSGMLDVMLVMQGLGSYSIARHGSDELRRELLPSVARAERIAAIGLTEPGAGSDLGGVSTRAERDGDSWRLTGGKTFISNAGLADVYTVLARTSGEPGDGGRGSLTAFFVPGDAAGLSVERFEVLAPHPIGEVLFDGVAVPDAHRLGEVGAGLEVALGTLARFRTSVAAAANGFARRALDASLDRLRGREQFGRPLSTFQGLRFELADMDARLRAAELLVDEAARAVDSGETATAEVARAKLFATEAASWICDRAVQHFGGTGVRKGAIVERLFRDVRALRIYEGTSEVQKLILAKHLLDART